MKVISVMNYKGGVGKTTIVANLGAYLASQGRRALLIDFDPQSSLTFSFYSAAAWEEELAPNKTLKEWFGKVLPDGSPPSLNQLVCEPPALKAAMVDIGSSGCLHLIASHLELVNSERTLSGISDRARGDRQSIVRLNRILADSLEDERLAHYDYVLIDTAPEFGPINKMVAAASDYIVVPAKADHLSTLGISHLIGSLRDLVRTHNNLAQQANRIDPTVLGVVFTMVQFYAGKPIAAQAEIIHGAKRNIDVPVFNAMTRYAARNAIAATQDGIPTVLRSAEFDHVTNEFVELTTELMNKIAR